MPRLLASLLSALLLALSFPLTLPALPTWLLAGFPFALPADPALGSFSIPGLDTSGGYIQFPALAFIALVPLLLAVRAAWRPAEAFGLGMLTGFVWLLLTLLWINNFGMTPVLLLSAYFALPLGLFCWLAYRLMHAPARPTPQVARLIWGLPLAWVGIEYLRSFGLWSFPWNLLGYTQASIPLLVQTADTLGVYGVSFLVALINCAVVLLLSSAGTPQLRLRHVSAAALLALAYSGYGWWRLHEHAGIDRSQPPPLDFALVQGGYSSLRTWTPETFVETLDAYVPVTREILGWPEPNLSGPNFGTSAFGSSELGVSTTGATDAISASASFSSEDAAADPPTALSSVGPPLPPRLAPSTLRGGRDLLVVWPESAISRPGGMDPRRAGTIPYEVTSLLHGQQGAGLLLGAIGMPHLDRTPENGCILVDSGGLTSWPYSKIRLVPFGEAVPFRNAVTFLQLPWDFGGRDIVSGRDLEPMRWREHSFGPLICFDNVFPFVTRQQARRGAQYFVLMTNNSWYPMRSGVRQHADLDVLRAVECRRPLLRVSTTGWSQVVEASGRITRSTHVRVGAPETLRVAVTPGTGTTPYMLIGDLFAQLSLLAALVVCLPPLLLVRSEGFL